MTAEQARIWNAAIKAACAQYKYGIGAIKALRVRHIVTVEHIGRSTKQDIVEVDPILEARQK